jgi:Protein of unknown function (DUF2877)
MPVGTASARPRLLSCSTCIAGAITGPLQRGLVHSVFKSAANIVFPCDFVLSLNTVTSPRMPNGIQLATLPGTMPFLQLQVGMPALLGVQRLCIQPLDYVLDLSHAAQWHPHIERPATLDMRIVQKNCAWLKDYVLEGNGRPRGPIPFTEADGRPQGPSPHILTPLAPTIQRECVREAHASPGIVGTGVGWWMGGDPCGRPSAMLCGGRPFAMLCGRGIGLTPTGDDMLAGWMAIGWLLKGPEPDFLADCQQIVAIARRQTHLLSQCWLGYAANGYVAEPIGALLLALTQEDNAQLAQATQAVLAMGATSGYDVIQGMLMATSEL